MCLLFLTSSKQTVAFMMQLFIFVWREPHPYWFGFARHSSISTVLVLWFVTNKIGIFPAINMSFESQATSLPIIAYSDAKEKPAGRINGSLWNDIEVQIKQSKFSHHTGIKDRGREESSIHNLIQIQNRLWVYEIFNYTPQFCYYVKNFKVWKWHL